MCLGLKLVLGSQNWSTITHIQLEQRRDWWFRI